ncbi:MAG: MBL fold metallo-hydrolase [Candidatus Baldrarchaeia archaeon]
MEIVFLGTSGSYPSKDRACPAILLDKELLIDCGEGATQRLLSLNLKPDDIERVFISHVHADHISGIVTLLWTFWLGRRTSKLKIYGPTGIKDAIHKLLQIVNTPIDSFLFEIEFIEIEGEFKEGDLRTYPVDHTIFTLALRVSKEKSVTYSSDTRPCADLITLAEKSTLLIHETTFPNELRETAIKFGHSTPQDAAWIAKESGSSSLILFHIPPEFQDMEKKFLKQAEEKFLGSVLVAYDQMRIVL